MKSYVHAEVIEIDGLVEKPIKLTMAELEKLVRDKFGTSRADAYM